MILWLLGAAVALVVVLAYLQYGPSGNRAPVVSGYGSIPILSPFLAFASNPRDLFIYIRKKYAKEGMARLSFFNLINVNIVFGTQHVEAFFKSPESQLSLEGAAEFAIEPLLGISRASNDKNHDPDKRGDTHAWIKESITKTDQLTYMMTIANELTDKYLDKWEKQGKIDLFKEFYSLIVAINIRCFVGESVREYAEEMIELLWTIEYFGTTTQSMFNPYSSQRSKSVAARKRIVQIFEELRRRRLKEIEDGTYNSDQNGRDVLQVNLDMGKTNEEIVASLLGLFFAAQTNTVSTTSWTVAYLANWQEWQDKAREEVLETFGKTEEPTMDKVKDLNVLGGCLAETVRKNAVAFVFRKAMKPLSLADFKLYKGDFAVVSPSVQHTNEEVFPEPEKWKPERFVAEGDYRIASKKFGKNFVQWGYYVHRCLGEHFANVVMRVVLVKLIQRFKFDIDKLSDLDYSKALGMPFAKEKITLTLTKH